jgi:hypothetical protein
VGASSNRFEDGGYKEWEVTFSYPFLSMRVPSKINRKAEKYERIGSENPTVGMAASWKHVTFRDNVNEMARA